MSRAYAKIVKVTWAEDRLDRGYWGAHVELLEPATGSAFVPIDDRLTRVAVGKTAIIENYGPGAPILFIVGILDETPASLIEKLTGEVKAALVSSKPVAQRSDLEVVKAMLMRAGIVFERVPDSSGAVRLVIRPAQGDGVWAVFDGQSETLVQLKPVFG